MAPSFIVLASGTEAVVALPGALALVIPFVRTKQDGTRGRAQAKCSVRVAAMKNPVQETLDPHDLVTRRYRTWGWIRYRTVGRVCMVSQSLAVISPQSQVDDKEVEQNLPTAPAPKGVIQFWPMSVPPRKPRQESLRPHPRFGVLLVAGSDRKGS